MTGSRNLYMINGLVGVEAGVGSYTNAPYRLTPIEARDIDAKLDDGISSTGKVFTNLGASCTTGGRYDIGATNGNAPNCNLMIDF